MKTSLSILILITFNIFSIECFSQTCTPNPVGYTTVPDTGAIIPSDMPILTVGVPFQEVITIGVPSRAKHPQTGLMVDVNWIKFLRVESKLGNVWSVVNSQGGTVFPQWNKRTWQCITVSGTPTIAGEDSIFVFVDFNFQALGFPTTLPNVKAGGAAMTIVASTNINQQFYNQEVVISPNPSSDFLSIKIPDTYNLQIFSFEGKPVFEKTIFKGIEMFDFSNLAGGIYIVKLTNTKETKTLKWIKK